MASELPSIVGNESKEFRLELVRPSESLDRFVDRDQLDRNHVLTVGRVRRRSDHLDLRAGHDLLELGMREMWTIRCIEAGPVVDPTQDLDGQWTRARLLQ